MGAPPLIKVPSDVFRSETVAILEFEKNVIPLSVVRERPDGSTEVINLS